MDLRQLIEEYYDSCKIMQLATVSGNRPWLCTVNFCFDNELNLYWTSTKARRHSKEINANPQVAVAIVKDPVRKQALQIVGEAFEVEGNDLDRVNKLYGDKFGEKPERLAEVRANTLNGRAYWVFKPTVVSLWDEVNFPDNPKQEYKLAN
jgi:uncharacterized protein YhbP (UPF0306 family)